MTADKKRITIDLPKDTTKKLKYAALDRDTKPKPLIEKIIANWIKDNCLK